MAGTLCAVVEGQQPLNGLDRRGAVREAACGTALGGGQERLVISLGGGAEEVDPHDPPASRLRVGAVVLGELAVNPEKTARLLGNALASVFQDAPPGEGDFQQVGVQPPAFGVVAPAGVEIPRLLQMEKTGLGGGVHSDDPPAGLGFHINPVLQQFSHTLPPSVQTK